MKIAIIGAGAMGGLFGARLSPFADVWLLGTWLEHLQAMAASGLRLTNLSGEDEIIPLQAVANPADVGDPVDLAIIFVKSHQTTQASQRAKPILKPDGLALTMQNGLGNLEHIAAVFGEGRVVQGVTSHGATLVGPGHIRHAGAGATVMAVRPTIAERIAAVQAVFEQAGFETGLSDNLDTLLWGKLIINVGINALTAILQIPNRRIVELEPARQIMAAAVAEAATIAQAKSITLPYPDAQAQVEQVALATGGNRSSMLADVLRGAPTEIDAINGAIVHEGERLGIAAPVNQTLVRLVKGVENLY